MVRHGENGRYFRAWQGDGRVYTLVIDDSNTEVGENQDIRHECYPD